MKYLFLYYGGGSVQPGTEAYDRGIADWDAAKKAMAEAGVLIECSPLYPAEAATTVRVRDGEALLTDGPAAEIKEQLGGFTLVECGTWTRRWGGPPGCRRRGRPRSRCARCWM